MFLSYILPGFTHLKIKKQVGIFLFACICRGVKTLPFQNNSPILGNPPLLKTPNLNELMAGKQEQKKCMC